MKNYKKDFSEEELQAALHKNDKKAKEIIEDPNKWAEFKIKFEEFLLEARKVPVLGSVIGDVITMVELVDAYVNKEYKDIPLPTIISIVAAVIYVVSPIDLIPDWIPFVGYLDDVAVVILVLHLGVDKDLDKFRNWEKQKISEKLKKIKEYIVQSITEAIKDEKIAAIIYTDDEEIKLLVTEDDTNSEPFECSICVLNSPTNILAEYGIENRDEIISQLQEALEKEEAIWADGAERKVIYEPDFIDMWEKYVIKEE